ncbi:MAG: zinc-binding dehydrogenase [Cytophagales bacterium]|nr:zinc-binding dehydrogenase [Cytophagales bacterium]
MKAVVFSGKGTPLQLCDVPTPKPTKDQMLVKLQAAAINHRDLWIQQELDMTGRPDGIILGSDGCGIVTDLGEEVDPLWMGAEVIIHPSLNWGSNPIVQGDSFQILGNPDNGTFAEYIAVSRKNIFEKPPGLSKEECAAVPLSGLTAYRALFSKARLRSKERVLITGIGGGAALWALRFALAYGATVHVTSSSDEKIKKAIALGAKGGFNYTDPSWADQAKKEAVFDIIIDSAGGDQFPKLLDLAVPGGRIVNFGRTAGAETTLSTRLLYWKQLSIFGTTMGTRDEFMSMIDFIESRSVKPVIDKVFALENIQAAFQRMESQDQFGKIILAIT